MKIHLSSTIQVLLNDLVLNIHDELKSLYDLNNHDSQSCATVKPQTPQTLYICTLDRDISINLPLPPTGASALHSTGLTKPSSKKNSWETAKVIISFQIQTLKQRTATKRSERR